MSRFGRDQSPLSALVLFPTSAQPLAQAPALLLQNINSVPFIGIKYRIQEERDIWGRRVDLTDSDVERIREALPGCQRKEVLRKEERRRRD